MNTYTLAYNKDNQACKEPLCDAVDTGQDCLRAFGDMSPAIQANRDSMYEAARRGFSTATDLADYLVCKVTPFRDSHEVVGNAVAYGIKNSKDLSEMSLEELQKFSSLIDQDVFEVLTLEGSVAARNHQGGTAPEQVKAAADRALKLVKSRS